MLKGKVEEFLYDFSVSNNEADVDLDLEFSAPKTLSASVRYINDIQDVYTESFVGFTTKPELANKKLRQIAQKLASAIDKNSIKEIKNLKEEYGNTPEFLKAQKLLNQNCKTVWNVFDIKDEKIPQEAMKALGITNIPSLDFLLGNTIKCFEKDNCQTTSRTIDSILNNRNLNYTIHDIHKYFVSKNAKLNFNTVKYLIEKHKYSEKQLQELKVDKSVIQRALEDLSLKISVKYQVRNIKTFWKSCNISDLIILCK